MCITKENLTQLNSTQLTSTQLKHMFKNISTHSKRQDKFKHVHSSQKWDQGISKGVNSACRCASKKENVTQLNSTQLTSTQLKQRFENLSTHSKSQEQFRHLSFLNY